MKLIKYVCIVLYTCILFSTVAHAREITSYSFNTYNLYEETDVIEFLNNPSVEWLMDNSKYIREYNWQSDQDYYEVYRCNFGYNELISKNSFLQETPIWYNTDIFVEGYRSTIASKQDFLKWCSIDNVNDWIKELGFEKKFEEYAIINVPSTYPNMIFLRSKDDIYILAVRYSKEQEIIEGGNNLIKDKIVTEDVDAILSQKERTRTEDIVYDLLGIDEFIKQYGRGYNYLKSDLSSISIDGTKMYKNIAVIYAPNEDVGYIELKDIEYIFASKIQEISNNNNTLTIKKGSNKMVLKEPRKMPLSNYFLPEQYNVLYKGKDYRIFGYGMNGKCYINVYDISQIFNADIGVLSIQHY